MRSCYDTNSEVISTVSIMFAVQAPTRAEESPQAAEVLESNQEEI